MARTAGQVGWCYRTSGIVDCGCGLAVKTSLNSGKKEVLICAERRKNSTSVTGEPRDSWECEACSAVVVLVEVSLTRKRVHARVDCVLSQYCI